MVNKVVDLMILLSYHEDQKWPDVRLGFPSTEDESQLRLYLTEGLIFG